MSASAFDPKRDHRIPREEAAGLVKGFHSGAKADEHRASAFNRSAFEHLLAQPGAEGIRIHRAKHQDGSHTMVMVAVDANGQDIAGNNAVFVQKGTDCPPNCGGQTWF